MAVDTCLITKMLLFLISHPPKALHLEATLTKPQGSEHSANSFSDILSHALIKSHSS